MTLVQCPKCGFRFDTSYGRVMACGNCPSASMGNCGYAKCPRCEHEWPLEGTEQQAPQYGRRIA
ncbi:MAG: hypothetical protein ACFE89_05835 [Candidatus Hodarchaeota archaeon]